MGRARGRGKIRKEEPHKYTIGVVFSAWTLFM